MARPLSLAPQQPDARTQAAAAEEMIQRSRAHDQDPSCTVFWTSRGYATPPWRWTSFMKDHSSHRCHVLALAENWPRFLEALRAFEEPIYVVDQRVRFHNPLPSRIEQLRDALRTSIREHVNNFNPSLFGDCETSVTIDMLFDVMNLRADASLFDHLDADRLGHDEAIPRLASRHAAVQPPPEPEPYVIQYSMDPLVKK